MSIKHVPDPTLMARLQLSVKGVDWAASLVAHRQHEQLPGEWSAHQHLYHLLAVEREVFQPRIKRILASDGPVFRYWDTDTSMRAHTPARDIEELAAEFMAEREATVALLKRATPDHWVRRGTWPDGRRIDLAWMAEHVLIHALEHFVFLLQLHSETELFHAPAWLAKPD